MEALHYGDHQLDTCTVRKLLTKTSGHAHILSGVAPACNPTLQVIGLQRPCMEKAGVAVNAPQLY